MNDEQLDLARRLVARPEFSLSEGLVILDSHRNATRVVDVDGARYRTYDIYDGVLRTFKIDSMRDQGVSLNLYDHATGGVLLDMVRAVFVEVEMSMNKDGFALNCWHPFGRLVGFTGATLAEACARALLAMWGDEPKGMT